MNRNLSVRENPHGCEVHRNADPVNSAFLGGKRGMEDPCAFCTAPLDMGGGALLSAQFLRGGASTLHGESEKGCKGQAFP